MKDKHLLLNDDTFCMLPWIHMHIWPEGATYPCCVADNDHAIGNTQTQSLAEIWNGEQMKTLRQNMLNGKESPACSGCYKNEKLGIKTLRNTSNEQYGDSHWWKVEETEEDGSAGNVLMAYLDIRFSNICNLKCRSCGSRFSTSWYEDHKKLYGTTPNHPKVLQCKDDMDAFFEELKPLLLDVERCLWAGGESIITEEHYKVMDYWLENNKTDILLRYTTNFTNMNFKKKSVFEYWKHFNKIEVSASLDANHERGEYLRKNMDWKTIVDNRKQMIAEVPHAQFIITPTVSAYNILNLPDFHREWIEEGLVEPDNFRINLLFSPEYMNVRVLTPNLKKKVEEKFHRHINYLQQFSDRPQFHNMINGYHGLLQYMNEEDWTHNIPKFKGMSLSIDKVRNEDTRKIFPELIEMFEYAK